MLGLYHKKTDSPEEAHMPETEKSLADILGGGEEQHPLTTSVDALLDDDTSLDAQSYVQEQKIDLQLFDKGQSGESAAEFSEDVSSETVPDDSGVALNDGEMPADLDDFQDDMNVDVFEDVAVKNEDVLSENTETVSQDTSDTEGWIGDEPHDFVPSVPPVRSYDEENSEDEEPIAETENEEPEIIDADAVYGRQRFPVRKSVLRRVNHNTGPYFEVKAFTDDLNEACYCINENSGSEMRVAEDGKPYLKLDVNDKRALKKWALCLFDEFDVQLGSNDTELYIPKAAEAVRFAHFMQNGYEKLCVYNQETYRFIEPLDEHFSAQNGIVYGHLDDNTAIHVCDFVDVRLTDKFGSVLEFSRPMSGRLQGPKGMAVYFADVQGIVIGSDGDKDEEVHPFSWEDRLPEGSVSGAFVFSEDSSETEFIGSAKMKILQVKVNSLYGWNIRFDNNVCMSLRDALDYQAKYNKLPDTKGKLLFGNKCLRFMNVVKIVPDIKRVYFSYGHKKK